MVRIVKQVLNTLSIIYNPDRPAVFFRSRFAIDFLVRYSELSPTLRTSAIRKLKVSRAIHNWRQSQSSAIAEFSHALVTLSSSFSRFISHQPSKVVTYQYFFFHYPFYFFSLPLASDVREVVQIYIKWHTFVPTFFSLPSPLTMCFHYERAERVFDNTSIYFQTGYE